jgi:hypothetical protein
MTMRWQERRFEEKLRKQELRLRAVGRQIYVGAQGGARFGSWHDHGESRRHRRRLFAPRYRGTLGPELERFARHMNAKGTRRRNRRRWVLAGAVTAVGLAGAAAAVVVALQRPVPGARGVSRPSGSFEPFAHTPRAFNTPMPATAHTRPSRPVLRQRAGPPPHHPSTAAPQTSFVSSPAQVAATHGFVSGSHSFVSGSAPVTTQTSAGTPSTSRSPAPLPAPAPATAPSPMKAP